MKFISIFFLFFIFIKCSKTVTIQYPIFPKSATSNKIYNFIQNNRDIAIIIQVSKKNSERFSTLLQPFLKQLFKNFSYYKIQMIENEEKKIKASKINLIAYFNFEEMIIKCNKEMDYFILVFPIQMKLLNVKKKQSLNISLDSIQKISKQGSCASTLLITKQTVIKSTSKIQKYFLPKSKSIKMKFFTKFKKDKVIEKILKLSYKEFKRGNIADSIEFLQKIERDKTWQGFANLGNCYYAVGNLQKANFYYQKAILIQSIDEKNKQYLLKLKKKIIGTAINQK